MQNESASDWGVPGSSGPGNGSSINGGGWGTPQQPQSGGSGMSDITNLTKMSQSSPASSVSTAASVWQTSETGDSSKNSWNMNQAQSINPKNGLASSGSVSGGANNSTSAQQSLAPGLDQENIPAVTVPVERTHQETLIYRTGWGQVSVFFLLFCFLKRVLRLSKR